MPTMIAPHLKDKHIQPPEAQLGPLTVDELVRNRAAIRDSQPGIYYPRSGLDYMHYPLRHLDVYAFWVARILIDRIPPRTSSSEAPTVVSLLGPSDLNYLVALLALSKLGHSVLFLSTRISVEAYVSLLEKTRSRSIFIHESMKDQAEMIKEQLPDLCIHKIPTQETYDFPIPDEIDTNLIPHLDPKIESTHVAWIIHSSGSTGLPKPIYQTQKAAIKNYAENMNMSGFITLPLYHNHGISCLFRTIYACKTLHLYNAELPLTSQHLLNVMRSYPFEIFYGVPYALKLLAETKEGINALAGLKAVMFGGSPCPDSLGNLLVDNGVHLISHYGSTETGQLMTSMRSRDDKTWDYVRPSTSVKNFINFEERYPGVFELVVLDGWPSKVMSNREDGAYATKDLFLKHPTMEAYKYYARLDDTIVLVNGEKLIPLALEGRVRQLSIVTEALAFGSGKSSIGLVVIRSSEAASLSEEEFIDFIWPAIEESNKQMPAYGQLSKNMIRVLPPDSPYPRTDKGTIIRQAFYIKYSNLIEAAYEANDIMTGTLVLSEAEIRGFLKEKLLSILPLKKPDALTDHADFFSLGMDSLQATQLRSVLIKSLDTNGQKLGLNIAFENPTISQLAHYLAMLRSGGTKSLECIEDQMRSLISKYSHFEPHVPRPNQLEGRYIVITGATGSLGCHLVAKISMLSHVQEVYCLIRAHSPNEAYDRLMESLHSRQVYSSLSSAAKRKLIAIPSDLSNAALGLDQPTYSMLTSRITDVIHCAWSVNFNLHLSSFEKDSIAGLKHLLDLCLKAERPTPATLGFCSSISAVINSPSSKAVPETLPAHLSYAQDMGYAQSKLVAEHLCIAAIQQTGMQARILRIGQVIGDTTHGIWNPTEAIPLMLQSAFTIGVLPTLDEYHLWLPVDRVASIIIDISLSSASSSSSSSSSSSTVPPTAKILNKEEPVYNIISPNPFHWTNDLLPYLRHSGMKYKAVEPREWIATLRTSNPDPVKNPPIKLLDFFAGKYENNEPRKRMSWCTERTKAASQTFDQIEGLDRVLVDKMVGYFHRVWSV